MNARLRGYGIDSVRVLELLMSIEEEFGIELKVDQMSQIGTVRDLVEHIDAQTAHGGYQLDRTATS
jgi:acyl carrier protein